MRMSAEEQLRALPGQGGKVGTGLAWVAGGCAVLLVLLGLLGVAEKTPSFVFGAFCAFFSWVFWSAKTRMQRAWRAYTQSAPRRVRVLIEAEPGDSRIFYYGRLEWRGARLRLQFYNPVGWTPEVGERDFDAYQDLLTQEPILLLAEQGVLIVERTEAWPLATR